LEPFPPPPSSSSSSSASCWLLCTAPITDLPRPRALSSARDEQLYKWRSRRAPPRGRSRSAERGPRRERRAPQHVFVPLPRRVVHRTLSQEAVDGERVGALLQQPPRDRLVPGHGCTMEWPHAVVALRVRVCPVPEEHLQNLHVAHLSCDHERRLPRRVLGLKRRLCVAKREGSWIQINVPLLRGLWDRHCAVDKFPPGRVGEGESARCSRR